jgi:hypothetical protein
VSSVHTLRHNRTNTNPFFPNNASLINECSGAPGLGFDFTHFFAVHPNCNHQMFGGVVLPFIGGGGFYMPVPYYAEATSEEQAASEPSQTRDETISKEPGPPAQPRENANAPLKPVNEFVFVKRDGTRIFAVAYSLMNGKIQYVTKEGLRRTLTLDALDFDQTEKSNEERGNTINLPKPLSSSIV